LTASECDQLGSLWLGVAASCGECPLPPVCLGGGLFTQSPDPPSDFIAGTSEESSNLRRWENFTGVAGAIEGLTWWGLDLENIGGNNFIECVETTNDFRISFHEDAGGVPGPAVCSYQLPVAYTPTGGLKYLGTELNEYDVSLPTPCVLVNGWVSIVGLGDPSCWFLWMSSSGGDNASYCDHCQPSPQDFDVNVCLDGTVGGVSGSCCDDSTAVCTDDVDIAGCLGPSQRFSSDETCSELDPPCGTIVGACCKNDATCTIEQQTPCELLLGGNWIGANTLCDQCPCITPCPPGGLAEGEPVCADEYVDIFNNGCQGATPAFSPIAVRETVCGESGAFRLGAETVGDFDWYEVDVPIATELVWSVEAEFEPHVWIFNGNSGCAGATQLAESAAFECDEVEVSAQVNPGTYWLVVGLLAFTDATACPSRYTARVSERPLGFALSVDRDELIWTSQIGATGYDVVRGDLNVLRNTSGDFTTATEECVINNHPTTSLPYTDDPQIAGEGFWILVRAVAATGNGTYDTGEPGQVSPRDDEIDASPEACP
jgi:hypothetical protein